MQADQAFVAGPGRVLDLQYVKVAVEELADRGFRSGAALVVHLGEQAGPYLLGLLRRRSPRRDDLGEVVPLLRERVEPRVDADSVGAARQGFDLTSCALAGLRRGAPHE
ncbi:hypothetical protein BJF90_42255 [Pseudonocardia sp. CNS-004]|nr:hypothetical protein BJF90_42255 [Pseudonocardia sp. CNS-004]